MSQPVELYDVRVVDGYVYRAKVVEVLNRYFKHMDELVESVGPLADCHGFKFKVAYDYCCKVRTLLNFLFETGILGSSYQEFFDYVQDCILCLYGYCDSCDIQEGDFKK